MSAELLQDTERGIIASSDAGLVMDGGFEDWTEVGALGCHGASGPGFSAIWAATESGRLFLSFIKAEGVSSAKIYLEIDPGADTGWRQADLGFDLMVSGDWLYSYKGNGSDLEWQALEQLPVVAAGDRVELAIPLEHINGSETMKMAMAEGNGVEPGVPAIMGLVVDYPSRGSDVAPPVTRLRAPAEGGLVQPGLLVAAGDILDVGEGLDTAALFWSLDGAPGQLLPVAGSSFSLTVSASMAAGTEHELRITASDKAGNNAALIHRFFVTDNDGMDDAWEIRHFGNLSASPDDDADKDGLSNAQEAAHGTDPASSDTDKDRIPDAFEVKCGLDPSKNNTGKDSDGDGMDDISEFLSGRRPDKPVIVDKNDTLKLRVNTPLRSLSP